MSEIKIKISAELDIASVQAEVQSLVRDLENGAKFKIEADSSGLSKVQSAFQSTKSQIEQSGAKFKVDNSEATKQLGDIEKQIGNVKDIKIKTTMDKDGNIDKMKVDFKEIDGTAKSISSSMSKKTGMFENSKMDSTVKSMKEIDNSYDGQLSKMSKILTMENRLTNLKDRSSKIKDKDSDQYKKAEADISKLTATTEKYKGSLQSVSKTDLKQLDNEIKTVNNSTNELWKTQQKQAREQRNATAQDVGRGMEQTGRGMMALSAPIVAAGAASIKMAIDYETAFTGVRKTVSATEPEFQKLSNQFREMSKVMPQSASAIAGVAEVAGQLGVKSQDIAKFSEIMIRMGDSTVLSAEQSAESMARFSNITGSPIDNVDRLASSVVSLGNNFAVNEEQIMDLALSLAGVGAQVGMTDADILGLSASLGSVGIGAEKGKLNCPAIEKSVA